MSRRGYKKSDDEPTLVEAIDRYSRGLGCYGGICGTCGCLMALVALILGIYAAVHIGDHPGEDSHTFCVEATDRKGDLPGTLLVGRVGVNAHEKLLCWDLMYDVSQVGSACSMAGVMIQGPCNSTNGCNDPTSVPVFHVLEAVPSGLAVGNLTYTTSDDDDDDSDKPENRIGACVDISKAQLQKFLRNPAMYFVTMTLHDACNATTPDVRDHFTGLCHQPEYDYSEVTTANQDLDDDDSSFDDDDTSAGAGQTVLHYAKAAGGGRDQRQGHHQQRKPQRLGDVHNRQRGGERYD